MHSLKMTLGERIKKTRLQEGLSQREIAGKSGITISFLSQVEKDKAAPSLKSLRNIAQALGIKVARLFDEDASIFKRIKIIKKGTDEKIILEDGESVTFRFD